MALTPVEIRHLELKRGLFGYRKSAVHQIMDEIAESFESVWMERSQLTERVDQLEGEIVRHVELEQLLRSTLVSAERAAQDMKEVARREADVIVAEANGEARKLVRDAITKKESALADLRRIQVLLRSALAVVQDDPAEATVTTVVANGAAPPATASDADPAIGEPATMALRRLA